MSPRCHGCDTSPPEGARFCDGCGRRLADGAPEDPRVGQVVLGRYRLLDVLGAGAMGTVYRAEQRVGRLRRGVAVKILHPHMSAAPSLRARFLRECELVVGLEHPNTIRFFDVGELEDGALAIVMELIEGETLSARLERGPMPLHEVAAVLRPVLGALAEAHDRGIVHRDVKPDNVMLFERAGGGLGVKLLDFGVAQPPLAEDATPLTLRGHLVGTPPYMSPEQLTAGAVDARSDLYAVGVMAYEMLTARHPLGEGGSLVDWITRHLERDPAPIEDHLGPDAIPASTARAIRRALAKSPENRPRDARELADALIGEPAADAPQPGRVEARVARALDVAPTASLHALPHPIVDDDPPVLPTRRAGLGAAVLAAAILAVFAAAFGQLIDHAPAPMDPATAARATEPDDAGAPLTSPSGSVGAPTSRAETCGPALASAPQVDDGCVSL